MIRRYLARVQEIEGRTLTDLGLVLALIAVVCAGLLTLFGENIEASFLDIASKF